MTFLADLARGGFVLPAETSIVATDGNIAGGAAPPASPAPPFKDGPGPSRAGGPKTLAEMREDRFGENALARPATPRDLRAELWLCSGGGGIA